MTVAKGINSGYVPLGAMIINQKLADWVQDKYFAGGLTYSGHVLACASAIASIEAFQEEGIVENSAAMGEVLGARARRADGQAPVDRRGARARASSGASSSSRTARRASRSSRSTRPARPAAPMASWPRRRWSAGLYLMTHWNVIIVAPPLTITREELDEGLGRARRGSCRSRTELAWSRLRRRGGRQSARSGSKRRRRRRHAAVSDLLPFARTDVVPLGGRALGGPDRGQHRRRARRRAPRRRSLGGRQRARAAAGARRRRAGRAPRPCLVLGNQGQAVATIRRPPRS